jgi:hypothetical protein
MEIDQSQEESVRPDFQDQCVGTTLDCAQHRRRGRVHKRLVGDEFYDMQCASAVKDVTVVIIEW